MPSKHFRPGTAELIAKYKALALQTIELVVLEYWNRYRKAITMRTLATAIGGVHNKAQCTPTLLCAELAAEGRLYMILSVRGKRFLFPSTAWNELTNEERAAYIIECESFIGEGRINKSKALNPNNTAEYQAFRDKLTKLVIPTES